MVLEDSTRTPRRRQRVEDTYLQGGAGVWARMAILNVGEGGAEFFLGTGDQAVRGGDLGR